MPNLINTNIKISLPPVLIAGGFENQLGSIFRGSSNIVIREYKKEIPVDRGLARNSVISKFNGDLEYKVFSTATNRGFNYPVAVYMGTGRYYKSSTDVGISARNRRSRYTEQDRRMFAGMAKRGVKFNIKPNKFVDRAYEKAIPKVVEYINNRIANLLNG